MARSREQLERDLRGLHRQLHHRAGQVSRLKEQLREERRRTAKFQELYPRLERRISLLSAAAVAAVGSNIELRIEASRLRERLTALGDTVEQRQGSGEPRRAALRAPRGEA